MSSEPTVEECLSELESLMPGKHFEILEKQRAFNGTGGVFRSAEVTVYVNSLPRGGSNTLAKAMAQVRQWHKEHKPNG